MDRSFVSLTEWLLRSCIDFDLISESLLPDQSNVSKIEKDCFPVGNMNYDVIIVPNLETIRSSTLDRLARFARLGGCILFLGRIPTLVDAISDNTAIKSFISYKPIPYEQQSIIKSLEDFRDIIIWSSDGTVTNNLFYQLREEEDCRWLFIAQADKPDNQDIPLCDIKKIVVRGNFFVTLYDTMAGETKPIAFDNVDGWTVINYLLYDHDSILLKLEKTTGKVQSKQCLKTPIIIADAKKPTYFLNPVPITLHEPNVLLLDIAEYALDTEHYRPAEEVLRLDNILRSELDWPLRGMAVSQPWVENDTTTPHMVSLRYSFQSEVTLKNTELALENANITKITLNGQPAGPVNGWYVDKCINKVALPKIIPGVNVIELTVPYGKKIDLEACYLLGDFAVNVQGLKCTLIKPIRKMSFGDITRQGLPFYGGNLTYHLDVETTDRKVLIAAPYYRGHLLRVALDGNDVGVIAYSPYELTVDDISAGKHRIDLKYYGSRVNTFGQLHRNERNQPWWGPDSWRTVDAEWTYEYRFWQQGVLKSPEVFNL